MSGVWEVDAGLIEVEWEKDQWPHRLEHHATIDVEELDRKFDGHSVGVTPDVARQIAAELVAFADWADAHPLAPLYKLTGWR